MAAEMTEKRLAEIALLRAIDDVQQHSISINSDLRRELGNFAARQGITTEEAIAAADIIINRALKQSLYPKKPTVTVIS